MKQILPFLILGAVLFSACKKENKQARDLCAVPTVNNSNCITDSNQIKAQIIGRWDWARSISAWVPVETTPCTDSVYRSYDFLSNGTIQYFENGNYVSTGTYTVSQSWALILNAEDTASTFWLNGVVNICDGYLIVDNQPVDGPKIVLARQGK